MKRSVKVALLAAAALVLVGCITMAVAFALGGVFEPEAQAVTHTVEGTVQNVIMNVEEADVHILPSEDGSCYAVCDETERVRYELSIKEDGWLYVDMVDERRWYEHIGISIGSTPTVTLYLPPMDTGYYRFLTVNTHSGDIVCTDPSLSFGTVALSADSGDIRFSSQAPLALGASSESGCIELSDMETGTLMLGISSGDIRLRNVTVRLDLSAESQSGGISLSNCTAAELSFKASSGGVKLENVTAESTLSAETASGSITLDRCDAPLLTIAASSGKVTASLLSDKLFAVQTNSGRVSCPPSGENGGSCIVRTSSGDVDICIVS